MAAKGAWIDLLCAMWRSQTRGMLSLPWQGYARLIGATVDQTKAAIGELIDMGICSLEGEEEAVSLDMDVTDGNGNVTIINRRMYREEKERESTRYRVQRHRNGGMKRDCNDDVTPLSSSSSSSSCTKVHLESSEDDSSPPLPEAEIFISVPLVDKTEFQVTTPMIEEWRNLYPKVDVEQALRNIRGWNLSHTKERKTRAGILKHITGWLAREQDRGGSNGGSRQQNTGRGSGQVAGTAAVAKSDSAPYPIDHTF